MTAKRAPRKRKESGNDVTEEFKKSYQKNFDCSNIKIKKMFPLTGNHMAAYHILQDDRTNILFLDGPSGSCKTYLSVYAALEMLQQRKVDQIIYIRTIAESASKSIGAIPGEIDDKFAGFAQVLMDKIIEITDKATANSLIEQGYIKAIPVNFVRGLTFNNSFVIYDEAQNGTRGEATTIISRVGRSTKYAVIGDARQKDIKDSGFETVYDLFNTEFSRKNNIYCMKFDASDIMRSPILRHITQVLCV